MGLWLQGNSKVVGDSQVTRALSEYTKTDHACSESARHPFEMLKLELELFLWTSWHITRTGDGYI